MARLVAPLMSQEASGKVGSVVHAKWKGRSYVRSLVTPHNPQSAGQVSVRAMHKFLAQFWKSISAGSQATYNAAAQVDQISPFNEYIRENQALWTQFKYPGQAASPDQSDTAGVVGTVTVANGVKQVTLSIPVSTLNQNWGLAIFRSTTSGFTPGKTNCIAVIPGTTAATFTYVDGGLKTGTTYYYSVIPFSIKGHGGTASTQESGTPN